MRIVSRLALLAVPVAFVWAMVSIVLVPVETGDAYPRYSSLRADPLGTKLLYDALTDLPGLDVRRNFKPDPRMERPESTAMLLLGVAGPGWFASSENRVRDWERIAARGARLVFVFEPALPALEADFSVFENRKAGSKPAGEAALPLIRPVQARWGVAVKLRKAPASRRAKMERMPRESALHFEPDASWTIAKRSPDGLVTELEKPLGKGSVTLVADGFQVSNEALREQRDRGQRLVALIGAGRTSIVFDEFHHGIAETGSIGALIRRYRLQGAVAVLLLGGLLFIWRSGTSLLPRTDAPSSMHSQVTGRDARDGLTSLLQRSIAPRELVAACWAEWRKDDALRGPISTARLARMEQAAAAATASGQTAEAAYRQLQNILTEQE